MIPILYEKTETAFVNNGLGRLKDTIEAKVTEERNSIYELDFSYPVSGQHFKDIQIGRIVAVTHDDSGNVQPFDIVGYSKPIDGIVTFHCTHISYRQSYMTVNGTNITSLSDAFTKLGTATPSNPFTYWADKTSTGYVGAFNGVPKSVRSILGGVEGSLLDAYGGEYEWDRFNVKLWSQRGQYRDFTIRYGVNMMDYNDETDASNCYSSLIPYWTDGTVTIVGDKQTSSNLPPSGREACVPLDVSEKFEDQPTKAQVNTMGASILNSGQPWLPSQNITVSFVRLQDTAEYSQFSSLLRCGLCDTIKVIFPDYQSSGNFKIVRTVWDVIGDRYEEMELGDLSISLSEALGISDIQKDSRSTIEQILSRLEDITETTTTTLTGSYNLTAKAYKRNGIVMIDIRLTAITNLPKGQWVSVGILPQGFRPLHQVDTLAVENNTSSVSTNSAQVRISTNGNVAVYAYSNGVTNNEVQCTTTYMTSV